MAGRQVQHHEPRAATFLQPRTLEALFWRSRGLERCEIAAKMGVSVKTIDSQTRLAVEALGISAYDMAPILARGGELKPKETDTCSDT